MDKERLRFLELNARHEVAMAIFKYEKDTNNKVLEVVLTRMPGRRDALVKFVVEESKSEENT